MEYSRKFVKKLALAWALLGLLEGGTGCGPLAFYPIAEPVAPVSDREILASMAIERAVIAPGDVPDANLLDRTRAIVLGTASFTITAQGDTISDPLTVRTIPQDRTEKFILLASDQIQSIADRHGDFIYLAVPLIRLSPDSATVTVETTWAVAKDSHPLIMSGGGYTLRFRKHNSVWLFEKIGAGWIF